MSEDKETDEIKNDEFRIDEEPRVPFVRVIKHNITLSPLSDEDLLRRNGISGDTYSLSELDDDSVEELSNFLGTNPENRYAEQIDTVVRRARCNNGCIILGPEALDDVFRTTPDCGAIYSANTILDTLMYLLGITETEDTASIALCVLLGLKNGLLLPEERESVISLYEYRNRCATRIYVEGPAEEKIREWKKIVYRLSALVFERAEEKEKTV
ncbi:MAG: hypothetical protein J5494_00665 [Candidatus Methanomethylophilaceae archaeon]|nr:hypothetical protein [Candidatus Methanomethylophilaceae archaeon]